MSAGEPIPLARPVIGAEEEARVLEVLRSGYLSLGPRLAEFELAFAGFEDDDGIGMLAVKCGHASTVDAQQRAGSGAIREAHAPLRHENAGRERHRRIVLGAPFEAHAHQNVLVSESFAPEQLFSAVVFAPGTYCNVSTSGVPRSLTGRSSEKLTG